MMTPEPTPNWCHPATVVRIVDGDTFVARIDLGRYPTKIHAEASIRIADLWCPELDEEGGREARAALLDILIRDPTVTIKTRKPNPSDVYGRIVGDVWIKGVSVAEEMIRQGHGKPRK